MKENFGLRILICSIMFLGVYIGDTFASISTKDSNDKIIVLNAVKKDGYLLSEASSNLRNDKKIVLAAVKQNGGALQFASKDLQANRNIVLEAAKSSGSVILQFASRKLQSDKEILKIAKAKDIQILLLAVTDKGGIALKDASPEFRADRKIILMVVKMDRFASALQYASPIFKDDKEVVLAAVKGNGYALKYASDRLKDDKEVVLAAVKQNLAVYRLASERLQKDASIIETINKIRPGYIPESSDINTIDITFDGEKFIWKDGGENIRYDFDIVGPNGYTTSEVFGHANDSNLIINGYYNAHILGATGRYTIYVSSYDITKSLPNPPIGKATLFIDYN